MTPRAETLRSATTLSKLTAPTYSTLPHSFLPLRHRRSCLRRRRITLWQVCPRPHPVLHPLPYQIRPHRPLPPRPAVLVGTTTSPEPTTSPMLSTPTNWPNRRTTDFRYLIFRHAIENYFFFPVTSSHVSPRSFLISSTFFQASSFIWRNAARAAA